MEKIELTDLIMILTIFVLYFIPSYFAFSRKHSNFSGVFFLNFLLGWTVIGWLIALIWSYSSKKEDSQLLDSDEV